MAHILPVYCLVDLRASQPVILLFALVFLIAIVLNPIVVWLHKHRVPRLPRGCLRHRPDYHDHPVCDSANAGTVAERTQRKAFKPDRNRSPEVIWQCAGPCLAPMRSQAKLPQPPQLFGTFLSVSTLGLVGGVASVVLSPILLLIFVLVSPRPLVAAYLALGADRYRRQAHRTLARMTRQMTAWARGVAINGIITGLSIGVLLSLLGVQTALIFGRIGFFR